MGEIVKRYQIGWLVEPDVESIRDTVNSIDRDQWTRFRCNVPEAVKILNWQNEERNLNRIYDAFMQSTRFAGD
jgi:glycosyltransferase involved in cell wall biosynthesis